MLITSNSSPTSGEMLEESTFKLECQDLATHFVPESSHTIEIQYITQSSEMGIYDSDVKILDGSILEESFNEDNTCRYEDSGKGYCEYGEIAANETIIPDMSDQDFELDTPSYSNESSSDSCNLDHSGETDLTNLNWLQNITNIMAVPTLPIPSQAPKPPPKPLIQNAKLHKMKQMILKCQEDFLENVEKYQSDSDKKPPYSYCALICLAMRYNGNKMTLSAIYSWIRDNFKYYRGADPSWQNSIRHNLSLNKVFVKVARSKQEPGKGGFWKLDLARLEESRRYIRTLSSPRPLRKKKPKAPKDQKSPEMYATNDIQMKEGNEPLRDEMMYDSVKDMNVDIGDITSNLPDLSLDGLEPVLSSPLQSEVGANVIVEPVLPEEEFGSLLLSAPWEDLQTDLLDSLLDSYLK